MSASTEAREEHDATKRENRKRLDATELIVFHLPIPDKAKLLCLYFLRTCDWYTLSRSEGRTALAEALNCSEDQVSRYTRTLDACGVLRIVSRGSNLLGLVHTYRIELDHEFWLDNEEAVAKIAAELCHRANKRAKTSVRATKPPSQPNAAIAECGTDSSRMRPDEQPNSASGPAEYAALPLSPSLSPTPSPGLGGGETPFERKALPALPFKIREVTESELEELSNLHGLLRRSSLISLFPRSESWSQRLKLEVSDRLLIAYRIDVTNVKYDWSDARCPGDPRVVQLVLENLVGERPTDPMSLEIKHCYPEYWPSASTGDLAIDEEKAALEWLKDSDRSGTTDDFICKMREFVVRGMALSVARRDAVIRNWRAAARRC